MPLAYKGAQRPPCWVTGFPMKSGEKRRKPKPYPPQSGLHTLKLRNTGAKDSQSSGTTLAIDRVDILP